MKKTHVLSKIKLSPLNQTLTWNIFLYCPYLCTYKANRTSILPKWHNRSCKHWMSCPSIKKIRIIGRMIFIYMVLHIRCISIIFLYEIYIVKYATSLNLHSSMMHPPTVAFIANHWFMLLLGSFNVINPPIWHHTAYLSFIQKMDM